MPIDTKKPWRRHDSDKWVVVNSAGHEIAKFGCLHEMDVTLESVNAHEDLVVACEAMLEFIDSLSEYKSRRLNPKEAARTVLAKAREATT